MIVALNDACKKFLPPFSTYPEVQMEMQRMVLIIDDSPTDIELTTIALEATERKISVCSASDGKSALAMLRNGLGMPALILLDLKMPGMGGIEVLREIRDDARLKEIPVVMVTSSALESDRADAIAAGADYYIQKPLDLGKFSKDLECIVHHWLPI
ncbi:MAG: response regulator [Dissulfurispiraceae bacterium]